MAEEREFHYRLARSRTRETSTLTIATVAVSASLIIFSLYIQAKISIVSTKNEEQLMFWNIFERWVIGGGILFAIFGIAYREVTALTIHRDDERWLRNNIPHLRRDSDIQSIARRVILLILLLMPLIGWAEVIWHFWLPIITGSVLFVIYSWIMSFEDR